MARTLAPRTGNLLLEFIPQVELDGMMACSSIVRFEVGQVVYDPGQRFKYGYAPIDCAVALLHRMEDGSESELGSTGYDGMIPARYLLGLDRLSSPAVCTVPGRAYRFPLDAFLEVADATSVLHAGVLRFSGAMIVMLAQYSGCNRFHQPVRRLARWLLVSQDHTNRDSFEITHEFLGRLLGVRRSALTATAGELQRRGAISCRRGRLTIRDRRRLKSAACECYGNIADEFRRLHRDLRSKATHSDF